VYRRCSSSPGIYPAGLPRIPAALRSGLTAFGLLSIDVLNPTASDRCLGLAPNNKNVRSMLPPQFTSIALTLVSIAITELLLGDRPPVPQEILQVRHVHVGLRRAAVDVGSPAGAWDAFATCQRHKRRALIRVVEGPATPRRAVPADGTTSCASRRPKAATARPIDSRFPVCSLGSWTPARDVIPGCSPGGTRPPGGRSPAGPAIS
jgi:hypothetical protein